MSDRYFMVAAAIGVAAAGAANATAAPGPAARSTAPAAQAPTRASVLKQVDANFKAIDTNGDGVLEPSELAAAELKVQQKRAAEARSRMEAEFTKLDTDKNGLLTKAEFMAAAPQPPTAMPDMTAAFTRLDTNKDGKITADEFSAAAAARFEKLDAKHTGVLNVRQSADSPPKTISRADFLKQASAEFAAIDTGHHGFVTKADLAAAELKARQQRAAADRSRVEAEFTRLDTNKDGVLTKAEFMAAAPQAPTTAPDPAKILAELDKNHDGKVSLDEYRAPVLARFDALDTNKDGTISQAERQAAQATRKR